MKPTDAFSRRNLFAALGVGVAGAAAWLGLRPQAIKTSLGGPDFRRGHRLWKADFPAPAAEESVDVVIAGGGIAGLAAGWMLADAGVDRFSLLELEDETGGNARGGENAVSAYPLGAHYLPVLNREAATLRRMLTTFRIIAGEKDGLPLYDPYQLCADLQERLLWRGAWQEGLIPQTDLTARDSADLEAFQKVMTDYRGMIGSDGKPAFTLPLDYCSQDPALIALDQLNFAGWLDARGWRSPVLRAYVRYCCRDDYGTEPEHVSAWAGVHYFAARRGWAADGQGDNLMTWPEGNAHLARLMAGTFAPKIRGGRIVFRAARDGEGVVVDSFDVRRRKTIRTRARAAIRCRILSWPGSRPSWPRRPRPIPMRPGSSPTSRWTGRRGDRARSWPGTMSPAPAHRSAMWWRRTRGWTPARVRRCSPGITPCRTWSRARRANASSPGRRRPGKPWS